MNAAEVRHRNRFVRAVTLAFLAGAMFLSVTPLWAQTGTVAGTVTDSLSGDPLPGVNVVVEETGQGSATGADGSYTITGVEEGTYTVSASFIGYGRQVREGVEVTAGQATEVDFALSQGTVALEEVVAVGYGEQQRRDVTGAISSVEGADLRAIPTPSAAQALQGQVAGVQVTPSSGEPGSDAVVRIRGVGTLNNASPLYVVDGMLTDDISFLNPNDIESVEVLKDASATAIYGSRGANGVIIITTQSGGRNQETIFSFDSYVGVQNVMDPIDLVNAQQYAQLANELRANEGQEPAFENPGAVGEGTDWQDVVYRTAPIQNYQLSAFGGTDRISYNFSGNYVREEGVLRKSNYERASLRINNDYSLTDAIELGHNVALTYREGVRAPGVVSAAYQADPTISPYTEDGDFANVSVRSSGGNPEATIFYHRNEYAGSRLLGDVFLNVNFTDHLRFRTNVGLDVDRERDRNFNPEFFVSPTQQNEENSLTIRSSDESSWLWENTLRYDRTIGAHDFDVLGGVTAQEFRFEQLGGQRINIVGEGESLWYLGAGQEEGQTNFNTAHDWSMLSFLFRTNYSYLNRYLLTLTGRADGSSRFGEENRFGYFPSVGVGWRIIEEPFMEGAPYLDDLKLRASWGQVGNDKIGAYPGIPVVSGNINAVFGPEGSYDLAFGASQIELANPNVQWETTNQLDVGLEAGLFERLRAEIDYYRRVTDGVLIRVPIPDYVGVNVQPFVNAASVLNSGFDLSLNWRDNLGAFSYRVGLVGSTVHNEVVELGQGREAIYGGGLVNEIAFTTKTVPGQPIGAFHGYRVAGVFQNEEEIAQLPTRGGEEPGDLRYEDINGDGIITEDDRTWLGSPVPDLTYGLNMRFSYSGLSLSANFNGQAGNQLFNAKKATRFGIENFEESYLDRWHGEGTSNTEPRITNAGHNYLASNRFIEDGSYFKLRNLRLGYALPGSVIDRARMQRAELYVSGTNLFTITDFSGYTPEIVSESVIASGIDTGVYPLARTITLGLNLTF